MSRQNISTSTIAGTIAFRNTSLANKFLLSAGYGPSRSPEEIAYKLNNYIASFGEAALESLAEIHPDRDVVLLSAPKPENKPAPQIENMNMCGGHNNYHNCNGGGCNCNKQSAPMHFNATGDETTALKSTNILDQKSIMMIGLFCITAISIVALTRKGA